MPLDVEMLLGKPGEGGKGQGFAYVASSELDPLLGCPNFTNGWVFFFIRWNIRIYKLLKSVGAEVCWEHQQALFWFSYLPGEEHHLNFKDDLQTLGLE